MMASEAAPVRINRHTPYDALPEYLSPEEARAFLALGRSTMYDLLRRGELVSVRFGRCIRIPKTAFRTRGGVE